MSDRDEQTTMTHEPGAGVALRRTIGSMLAGTNALAIALSACVTPLAAQPAAGAGPPVAVDTATLAADPHVAMETLLEKTLFKVDVLRVRLRFDRETTDRLRDAIAGGPGEASSDAIAAVALASTDVWARIRFERDVSLSQFLDGVLDDLERAVDAGIVSAAEFDRLHTNLPSWFGFLEVRRIRDGDELWYRIRGDTLRTLFVAGGGEVLLDQTDVGSGARLAVLGGYFAPGSELRAGLIESVFELLGDASP